MRLLVVATTALGWFHSLSLIDAFAPAPKTAIPRTRALSATAESAIAALHSRQVLDVEAVQSAIPDLAAKPDCSWGPADGQMIAGAPATLDARDAPGPANVAWLGALHVAGKLSSLTIFNGPLTDVPHLLSRCAIDDSNMMHFTLDFRPRAYGAYETRRPDGSYPGPEELGRQAFEYSGARNEFDNKFGTEEFQANLACVEFEGATAPTDALSEVEAATRGPLCLDLVMPLTPGNVMAVSAARNLAIESWKSWATDSSHEHRPGAPVNTQYVYDSKFKINCYTALLDVYSKLYPQDGPTLAAAESGPLDEAYVGGGS